MEVEDAQSPPQDLMTNGGMGDVPVGNPAGNERDLPPAGLADPVLPYQPTPGTEYQGTSEGRQSNMKSRHAILEQRKQEQERMLKREAETNAMKSAQRKAKAAAKKKEQRRLQAEEQKRDKEQQRAKAMKDKANRERKLNEKRRLLEMMRAKVLCPPAH
ncbi:unnamed protein product, partial [Discosporangium mesarthrocarpum]